MTRDFLLGKATISPTRVVAGSYTTISYVYQVGHPIDDTGYLKIVFRSVGDFGAPQFEHPTAPNYCSVATTGSCRLVPRWDPKGHKRPWSRALYLKIVGGFLNTGDQIRVLFGDRSQGSPGWQIQTFCEETFEFKSLIDPIATYRFQELPKSPTLQIVPGEPAKAVCIAPSQVTVEAAFPCYLKLEDRWGNPVGRPTELTHSGFSATGVYTLTMEAEGAGLRAESNPIEVVAEAAPLRPYWADFHGQSEETIGSNTIDDYFTFARDYALLDIAAHQGNDFQVTDEFWNTINETTRKFNQPGAFVTFPGYEWSGNTPLGGDRNVYFSSEGGRITRSSTELLPGGESVYGDSHNAATLFENLKAQDEPFPFLFAHVGGRYADLAMHDPDLELAVEVHSAWGTFEWLVEEALDRGYRVGFCANSDGHKGRPGASYPGAGKFGSYGGLTCVLAGGLDRESVVGALKARHFFATTGNRPLIHVALETDAGSWAMMGDAIAHGSGQANLTVRVIGTAPIERVELRNGLQTVTTFRPYREDDLGSRVKVVWSGAEVRGRDRMVAWDGRLVVEGNSILDVSPINFWNPDRQPSRVNESHVEWQSVTTGGLAGLVLKLKDADAGALAVETLQGGLSCAIREVGLEPRTWRCPEGLEKKIEIYRLPDAPPSRELSTTVPLDQLKPGDNAIYVHVVQEDGHMAWTSPIYLVAELDDGET
jgi:hypothetical protein